MSHAPQEDAVPSSPSAGPRPAVRVTEQPKSETAWRRAGMLLLATAGVTVMVTLLAGVSFGNLLLCAIDVLIGVGLLQGKKSIVGVGIFRAVLVLWVWGSTAITARQYGVLAYNLCYLGSQLALLVGTPSARRISVATFLGVGSIVYLVIAETLLR